MSQTILYVEDNVGNAMMVKMVLSREGFEVIIAKDGNSGLTLANTHQPDLIICDYHLPGHTKGPQFVQAIRSTPALATTPIIMLTADTSAYPDSMESGANMFVNKPINRETLLSSVNSLL